MTNTRTIVLLSATAFAAATVGAVAGYVANDLTERENPVTMQEIAEEQALQQDLDDFFDDLAASPPEETRSAQ